MPMPSQEKESEKILPLPETPLEIIQEKAPQEGQIQEEYPISEKATMEKPEEATPETQRSGLKEKSELLISIETILSSENLTKIFKDLPSRYDKNFREHNGMPSKEDFLKKGEEAAKKVEDIYNRQEITVEKIRDAVHEWLSVLPEMKNNDPFLEQEELNIVHGIVEYFEQLLQKPIE